MLGVRAVVIAALLLAGALALFAAMRARPQDLPWTPLDLTRPIGLFTRAKLVALGDDVPRCRALLGQAGVRFSALPPVRSGQCGYADGVRLARGGSRPIGYAPELRTACPVAAALALWEWHVVQPAAQRHFGRRVERVEHLGSYSCRRMYGRPGGDWSEHATADAVDIAGFRLAGGRRVRVLADWRGDGAEAAFLRDVRDGGCRLFATVLSPDYNAAHRDHLHFDQAARGRAGWGVCR